MTTLVDTNVLSELRKGERANARVRAWFEGLDSDAIALSAVTVGEIRCGIERIRPRDTHAARAIERWLRGLLREHGDRVLAVDGVVAEEWGRMNASESLSVVDGLIAATAKVHGLIVATRNVKDLARSGVDVINPFDAG